MAIKLIIEHAAGHQHAISINPARRCPAVLSSKVQPDARLFDRPLVHLPYSDPTSRLWISTARGAKYRNMVSCKVLPRNEQVKSVVLGYLPRQYGCPDHQSSSKMGHEHSAGYY